MATIPGSQFVATASGQPVNVVEPTRARACRRPWPAPSTSRSLPRSRRLAPTIAAPGYQGLAVLSPSGLELDLIGGAFAVTDNGTGNDTLERPSADNETISMAAANVPSNLHAQRQQWRREPAARDTSGGTAAAVNGGTGRTERQQRQFNDSGQCRRRRRLDTIGNVGGTGGATTRSPRSATATTPITGGSGPDLINVITGETIAGSERHDQRVRRTVTRSTAAPGRHGRPRRRGLRARSVGIGGSDTVSSPATRRHGDRRRQRPTRTRSSIAGRPNLTLQRPARTSTPIRWSASIRPPATAST